MWHAHTRGPHSGHALRGTDSEHTHALRTLLAGERKRACPQQEASVARMFLEIRALAGCLFRTLVLALQPAQVSTNSGTGSAKSVSSYLKVGLGQASVGSNQIRSGFFRAPRCRSVPSLLVPNFRNGRPGIGAGQRLALCWLCLHTALALNRYGTRATLVLRLYYTGTAMALPSFRDAGAVLVPHWCHTAIVWALCRYFIGPTLVLHN